jgi:2-dehydro-3-deoxygluconokinase
MVEVVALGEPLAGFYGTSGRPIAEETSFQRIWGGDTSNFVVALAKLGHTSGYITRVGSDAWGRSFMDLWSRAGVDTSHVVVDAEGYTGLYFSCSHDQSHEFTYHRKGSAASHLSQSDIDTQYVTRAKVLHLTGISQAISPSAMEACFAAIEVARDNSVTVSYDPNIRPGFWASSTLRAAVRHTILRLADVVELTLDEAHLLFGDVEPVKIAARLIDGGVTLVAVKMGPDGCLVVTRDGASRAPGVQVHVEDTVGAGDVFDAAVVACLLEGRSPDVTARFANAAAAMTCRGRGPLVSQPTREEVEHLLRAE